MGGQDSQLINTPKWLTTDEVAAQLRYGKSKVKTLIAQRRIRSVKDGKYRRILPEWVDEYVESVARQQEELYA